MYIGLQKSKFHLNLTRITDTLHVDRYAFLIISRSVLLRIRNYSDKVVEKIRTLILCSVTFFLMKRDDLEKYCRAGQTKDDNMAHAHCMPDT